jgi:hypothetical protein
MSCNESEGGVPLDKKGNLVSARRSESNQSESSKVVHSTFMNALSRREEDTLLKTTKARALAECDPIVKGSAMNSD